MTSSAIDRWLGRGRRSATLSGVAVALLLMACDAPAPPSHAPTFAPPPAEPSGAVPSPTPDADSAIENGEIRVDVANRLEWTELEPSTLPPGNRSAVAVPRAYDPATGKAFGSLDALGAQPGDLSRGFLLDRKTVLLGEPIVVEHRIELRGPGTWTESLGGNYRARGRDDNYVFFAVRRGERDPLPDPYAPIRHFMGGISTSVAVKEGAPMSYFLPVQPYVVIDEPGVYDLYCVALASFTSRDMVGFRESIAHSLHAKVGDRYRLGKELNDLVDGSGNPVAIRAMPTTLMADNGRSPLYDAVPEPLRAAIEGDRLHPVTDFGHFELSVKKGTFAERQAMVARSMKLFGEARHQMQASRADATQKAVWFSSEPLFLPALRAWSKGQDEHAPRYWTGLAMQGSDAAIDFILGEGDPMALYALHHLADDRVANVVPAIIARLEHEDERTRSAAYSLLLGWTDEDFGAPWDGTHSDRPTLEEGQELKKRAESWWQQHKSGFVPVSR